LRHFWGEHYLNSTTLNLARAEELGAQPELKPHVFSMASWKQRQFNQRLLDVFIDNLALDPMWVKNYPGYEELRTYGYCCLIFVRTIVLRFRIFVNETFIYHRLKLITSLWPVALAMRSKVQWKVAFGLPHLTHVEHGGYTQ
jgi:hypothetical protein